MHVPPFSVGVNYWPRRSGPAMWRDFDAAEIAEDFARIAGLGLDTVRVFVRWDEFAPQADAVDPTMLDRLTSVVSLASECGLGVMPVLFCGHFDGVNYVPRWALDRRVPRGPFRTRSGDADVTVGCATLYSGALLNAQLVFAAAVARRLRGHPAVTAWDIGHAFSNVSAPAQRKVPFGEHSSAPADERTVAEWSRRLTAIFEDSPTVPVTAGTISEDLTEDRNLRLGSLCAPFGFASMQGYTVQTAFARNRLDAEVVPFLAMLTAAFSYKRVLVSGFGNPHCRPNTFSASERFSQPGEPPNMTVAPDDPVFTRFPCLTEAENATYCSAVLERLHADGRLGAYWWCWTDYARDERTDSAAETEHRHAMGLVRADGSERPVAAALAAFARQRRTVMAERTMPMIAAAYYYRTLPTSTTTLYEAFLRHRRDRQPDGS